MRGSEGHSGGRHSSRPRVRGRRAAAGTAAFALLASVPNPLSAEPPPLQSRDDPKYTADVLVFHEEDRDEALVWIAVHCPASSIFFEPDSSAADIRLTWKVRRGKRQIDGDVLARRVEVGAGRRDEAAVLQTIPVRLEPGRYDLELEVGQPGAGHGSVVSRSFDVSPLGRNPFALSTLFLSAQAPGRMGTGTLGLPGFPLVPRVVSQDIDHVTLVGEIYAVGGCRERYAVTYRLVDDYDRVIQERSEEVPCEGFRTALQLPLDTTKLVFGDYRVEVRVATPGSRDEEYREIWFSADESLLPLRANFTRTLEVIEVIATEQEIDELRAAPPGEREALWDAFWERRDTETDTDRNEYKEAFFERLRYANQHYGTGTTRGWKTDRGYTLLKYGHPDRIQRSNRSTFGADIRAAETWEYYDEGLTFVFVDDIGLGDFRLVQSHH